jgi:tetratricopeptide (TPR) repeat protein
VHLDEALRLDPRNLIAHLKLGEVLLRQNQPEQAIPHFQRAILGQPDWKEAREGLDAARAALKE